MIVFVGGMPRSGSTFSFNVVREVLSRRGQVYCEASESVLSAIESGQSAQHLVVKGHSADQATMAFVRLGAIKAVCTVRKPEDAIASWMETFGFSLDDSLNHMMAWIKMFQQLRSFALVLHYDELDRHPFRCTRRIAKYLCPQSTVLEAASIVRMFNKAAAKAIADKVERKSQLSTDIGFSFYDNKTFLHRRHVSSLVSRQASERIDSADLTAIRSRLAGFIDDKGYLAL